MGKVFLLDQVLYPSKYCFQQFWKSSVCHNVTNEIYKIHQSVHAAKNKEEDLPLILRLHVIWVILNQGWSVVNIVNPWPAFLVSDQTRCIVVSIASGAVVFKLIRGKYVTYAAD